MFNFFKRQKPTGGRSGRVMRMFAAAECSRLLRPWVWDGGFSNAEVAAFAGNAEELRTRPPMA